MFVKDKSNTIYGITVFVVVYLVYLSSPIMLSLDSHWSIHTSLSMIYESNTDLNEYMPEIIADDYKAVEKIEGRYYTIFPIGVSILAIPFVAVADVVLQPIIEKIPFLLNFYNQKSGKNVTNISEIRLIDVFPAVEMVIASFYCAVSAVFVFLIARLRLSLLYSFLVVFIFAFCTSSWSTSSRALWQHGPSVLMLSIALYYLLTVKNHKKYLHYIAIPLALSFIIRPTNAIPIFFISFYVFINYRSSFTKYLLVAAPFSILYFAYNLTIYDQLLANYSQPNRVFQFEKFFEALAGNIISPARGLLVFSPILILAFYGLVRYFPKKLNSMNFLVMIIMLSHWFLISSFPHWYGGHSYGSRLFTDMLPFIMHFIVLAYQKISSMTKNKQLLIQLLLSPLLLFSFYVHYKGSHEIAVHLWNSKPTKIQEDTSRLWEWSDMQMFRN